MTPRDTKRTGCSAEDQILRAYGCLLLLVIGGVFVAGFLLATIVRVWL